MPATKAPSPISVGELLRPALAANERLIGVDACRGVAVLMMMAYHLCYDLAYVGFAPWTRFEMQMHAPWIVARTLIVTTFLLLVGFSIILRANINSTAPAFWRRWAQIAAAAALVSIASIFFSGRYWIYFGILHFIAVALLIGNVLQRGVTSIRLLALIGVAFIAAGSIIASPRFDAMPMNVLGFALHKPLSDDYVPLFPWLGVVVLGMALGRARQSGRIGFVQAPLKPSSALTRLLAMTGRWALTLYLVHEPVFIGFLLVARSVLTRP